ncbi:37S ribosomal protein S24, mitochondrial [Blyttiomyces sp. JEL0837]|nr:37S ribosomal protein S24, mitochondrial [Blyttiomyces sp. JEL0837]
MTSTTSVRRVFKTSLRSSQCIGTRMTPTASIPTASAFIPIPQSQSSIPHQSQQHRQFSSTPASLARRRVKVSEGGGPSKADDYMALSGFVNKDGLHRFELDFYETADWSQKLTGKPLVFVSSKTHTYDFTQPSPPSDRQKLLVHVGLLKLAPEVKHKFLLLAGKTYDPYEDVMTLKLEENAVVEAGSMQERLELVEKFEAVLKEANNKNDTFADVPVDLRHVRVKRAHLAFPEEWKRGKQQQQQQQQQ